MFIKKVVIDGFKSYAQRTEVNGFDPEFNAITGLNGSGKSNILDSICFVLGITALERVRAASLQDLVYKSGQAGVTKATVTIFFDNTDKEQSPLNFSDYNEITVTRQIVIGGRNKYLINGVSATNTRVSDMFRSVSLNVNNPHFLIMQGMITKVLNMKPQEILALIEESAGTKMYDTKKQNAIRNIQKKDGRVKEINMMLDEEIFPKVDELKKERAAYLEYQKLGSDIERLDRHLQAWNYMALKNKEKTFASDAQKKDQQMTEAAEQIEQCKKAIDELTVEIARLKDIKKQEGGDTYTRLESAVAVARRALLKAQSDHKEAGDVEKALAARIRQAETALAQDRKALTKKQKEIGDNEATAGKAEEAGTQLKQAYEAAQKTVEDLAMGKLKTADGTGEAATLHEQLNDVNKKLSDCQNEVKQAQMRLKKLTPELDKKRREKNSNTGSAAAEKQRAEQLGAEIKQLQDQITALSFNPARYQQLDQEKIQLRQKLQELRGKINEFEHRKHLLFQCTDRNGRIDKNQIHGRLASLFEVTDGKYSLALAVAAGGSLHHMVVETQAVVKNLLNHGDLPRRENFIPLDKVDFGAAVTQQQLNRAKQLVGNDNVHCALDLVEYERKFEKAMLLPFGRVLICTTKEQARIVAFDDKVRVRAVGLDGTDVNPAGSLTGGSRRKDTLLDEMPAHRRILKERADREAEMQQIEAEYDALSPLEVQYARLRKTVENKQAQLEATNTKIQQSTEYRLDEDIARLEQDIETAQTVVRNSGEVDKGLRERKQELDYQIKNKDQFEKEQKKKAEVELKRAKAEFEKQKAHFEKSKETMDTLKLEVVSIEKEIAQQETDIERLGEERTEAAEKAKELQTEVDGCKTTFQGAETEFSAHKAMMKARDEEILHCEKEKQAAEKTRTDKELELKQLETEIQTLKAETKDSKKRLETLLRKYDWIEKEAHLFGKEDSPYNFQKLNGEKIKEQLEAAKGKKESLEKRVNFRAMNMLQEAETKATELNEKKRALVEDREKLMTTIDELDAKKKQQIIVAWRKVNEDFCDIFSQLLPGTKAVLRRIPEAKDEDEQREIVGLEIRVAFGDLWKESLGELSGGQRSLVALSLVLAMLKFKPAPIYILDEVDAALDLSHTQNIGTMIKTHFKASQFIIVSLKDGMFNNANVLFKTKFIDGCSTVARFDGRQDNNKENRQQRT